MDQFLLEEVQLHGHFPDLLVVMHLVCNHSNRCPLLRIPALGDRGLHAHDELAGINQEMLGSRAICDHKLGEELDIRERTHDEALDVRLQRLVRS